MKYLTPFLLAGCLLTACKKHIESTIPATERITESVYAPGFIKSKNQYQVYATVSGLVQKKLVKEGDLVKKGDALLIIKNENARLNAENAQLTADFALENTRGDRLKEIMGAIETARSKMLNDSLLLSRQRGLWAQQIGSKVELEQRELAYSNARYNYEAALSRYNDLKKQLDFSAAQSKKLLRMSQTAAQDFIVRSQTDGRVYSLLKEEGEIVSPQTPIAIIGDAHDFVVELQVDENDIIKVHNGLRVLLTMDSYKGQVMEATLSQIDPIMNERTRTFKAEAAFIQPPPTLYPNLSAEANIILQSKDKALTIPRSYLLGDSMVILSNQEKRKVVIGLKDYQKAEILQGLNAQETIIKPE